MHVVVLLLMQTEIRLEPFFAKSDLARIYLSVSRLPQVCLQVKLEQKHWDQPGD